MMTQTRKFKFVIFITLLFVLINSFPTHVLANNQINNNNAKITDKLKLIMENASETDVIPISVWLDLVDLSIVEKELQTKYSIKSEDYKDEQKFQQNVAQELEIISTSNTMLKSLPHANDTIEVIRNIYNIKSAMTNDEIERCLDEGMTLADITEIGMQQDYSQKWRDCIIDIQKAHNNLFAQELERIGVKYVSLYMQDTSSNVMMEVTKANINKIASIASVNTINYYEEPKIESFTSLGSNSNQQKMNITLAQNTWFNSNSYGSGIKVGIIEYVEEGFDASGFDPSYPHIVNSFNSRIYKVINTGILSGNYVEGNYATHGAHVTAISVGDPVTISGKTYRGVAPQATTYFTTFTSYNNFKTGISLLLLNGTNIINICNGFVNNPGYTEVSQYLDEIVRNYNVTLCIAVGNVYDDSSLTPNSYLPIPSENAYAYNAIVIGNADTIRMTNGKYSIYKESAYLQTANLKAANKPDIVASGTEITYAADSGSGTTGHSGTSLSTPFVTGIVALMMQKQATLISKPANVKAILLAAANPNLIDGDQLRDDANLLYNKSGAGLVDAYAAISIITNSNFVSYYGTPSSANYDNVSLASVYLNAGDTIRVAGTFLKTTNDDIAVETTPYGTDLDFMLKESSSGSIVAAAASDRDNVEIFEFTAVASGYYTIQYAIWSLHTTPYTLHCSAAWTID